MSFLIVDDVSLMRKILADILTSRCGVDKKSIFEANDGAAAVREYKRLKPAVVFLDVLMPNMGGQEAVKEILAFDPNAYIVMCSSASERSVVKVCVKAGAKDYIIKPLDPERVKIALEKSGYKVAEGGGGGD